MNQAEKDIKDAIGQIEGEWKEASAWYESHQFYAGVSTGVIIGAFVFHFLGKL